MSTGGEALVSEGFNALALLDEGDDNATEMLMPNPNCPGKQCNTHERLCEGGGATIVHHDEALLLCYGQRAIP